MKFLATPLVAPMKTDREYSYSSAVRTVLPVIAWLLAVLIRSTAVLFAVLGRFLLSTYVKLKSPLVN